MNWVKVDDDVPSHAVITGADLYIENLNKSYNGTYRCMASNSVGESFDDYILYVYGTHHPNTATPLSGSLHPHVTVDRFYFLPQTCTFHLESCELEEKTIPES